ncbi:hypothetical protein DV736_g454, partial [Chaetothyriales sp. CBS 134916]
MENRPSLSIEEYQVGIICALRHEMTAAMATLDERHQPITGQDKHDPNNYVLGRVHDHNVVIACLPAGVYGTNAAARVANDMLRTFTGLRFGLMVGIGGGIPSVPKGPDIRLGDVVISQPDETYGGVVQYDLRKNLGEGHFERKGSLKPPPTMLLGALSTLQAEHDLEDSQVPAILAKIFSNHRNLEKNGYGFPGREKDTLYCPQCGGSGSSDSCNLCTNREIERPAREDNHPSFWYGTIASGNELIKNAAERDRIGEQFRALCVEMEAAGLMNDFPCLVIRGICDYADSHKNNVWQKYAALVAAAYAKEFLGYISPEKTKLEKPIQEVVASLKEQLAKQSGLAEEHLREVKQEHEKGEKWYQDDQHRQCHQVFKTSTYEQFKNLNPDRVDGTCQWVLSHSQYIQWYKKPHNNLLWISADPGCGKSVLAKSLVNHELRSIDQHTVCYFFFKDNEQQDNAATALYTLLYQLFSHQSQLLLYTIPAWKKTGEKLVKEVSELWCILVAAARDPEAHDVQKEDYNIDESDQNGRTALIWASEYGYKKVVQTLLEHRADVNAQGGHYSNALYAASEGGHEKVVQTLLEHGADGGHEKMVQTLLEHGADVNAQGGFYGNALYAASEGGHEKVVQTLLEHGADGGHEKMVQTLLEHGADVNAQGGFYGNALYAASEGGHEKVVQTLLEHGADVNAQGGFYGNTLYAASERGHKKVVQTLLEHGADINAQGGHYGNALQAASERGHEKMVQTLLEHGVDINAQGGFYGNTLQVASNRGHEKVVQTLLEHGADVNAQGGFYGNALYAASERGHEKVVQTLLEHGADINAQGGFYGNALYAASKGGHEKVV